MAPSDFGPYLCPLNSSSFMCYRHGFTRQSRFSRLITVPRENRSARKLLKTLASPTGFEPVFTP